MEKYASKFNEALLTPEPHYIPGFAGYCPQLKYTVGKSYGKLTSQLLSSPEAKHSTRLAPHQGLVPSAETDSAGTMKMLPGYTGFIPKRQNYYASSYSETCRRALTEFHQERRARIQRRSSDLPAVANCSNYQFKRPSPPFTAISDKVFSYKPSKPLIPLGKPYAMGDDDPNKYFISGFTGHVPKSRFLIGKGYPITTNQALIQFGEQRRSDATSQNFTERKESSVAATSTIYSSNSGVVPAFTGHIPGYKFMYGQTFGQLSKNAMEKSGIKRIPQDKL
ncbi:ciliary microtubule inner protein 2B [Labrus mixtus]|uniref:ciliary microtubule inner protein 2B n=1 Tax=Labrus mixtus TaxID=508554 RepID=UPI0029C0EFD3|nr:ciliary microtubule inner protein 2B [Labrus mixtus]